MCSGYSDSHVNTANRTGSLEAFTPKALANFSPGLERSDNPGLAMLEIISNPEESVGKK
jgi:hypothetical protein